MSDFLSEYDQGWCDGRDAAEIEFEQLGYLAPVIGGGRWSAIKHQIRGIINILQRGLENEN
tara:strand:+ start:83 stop:265 length:183 start_codon:yes stop_codon:yes gene_type:complete